MYLYFHLVSDTGTIWDRTGVAVDDVDHALADALQAVDEIKEEESTAVLAWSGWMLNITDARGWTLLWVDLGRTIQ